MPEVSPIGNAPRGPVNRSAPASAREERRFRADAAARTLAADRVELSERTHGSDGARSARRLRLERIEAVRAAIASGTYETDERLNVAIARLIDELRG